NSFPEKCPDGAVICGNDEGVLSATLKAEIPYIEWPLDGKKTPSLLTTLDFIEFCYKYIADPTAIYHHDYHKHNHFKFDVVKGQRKFRESINSIFSRNGIIYELDTTGQIIRLAPEGLREQLQQSRFFTQDTDLDILLNTARAKFLNPNIEVRKEALEKLWDAWERLKTIEPGDKKTSIETLLKKISPEMNFYGRLNQEAKELTYIGNNFRIRHHETDKTPIESSDQVDYLFHRMFSLIYLILKTTNRLE
ncbi:AbiJ-NTD4 domain-containing protein, partial [Methanocalculus sp.]|uniref:AbiJ-NTD4 domain-containing protein n=1 Tax=Methanocalculus sp. TaxID=2004547 RepID=UPI0026239F38